MSNALLPNLPDLAERIGAAGAFAAGIYFAIRRFVRGRGGQVQSAARKWLASVSKEVGILFIVFSVLDYFIENTSPAPTARIAATVLFSIGVLVLGISLALIVRYPEIEEGGE